MNQPRECLEFFAKIIESEIGVVYSDGNFYQLEARLAEIALQTGFRDVAAMWSAAKSRRLHPAATMLLLDVATNNETQFFRDPAVFAAIERLYAVAGPRDPERPFTVWSAACSTGQEAYSLAILAAEMSKTRSFSTRMLATDFSERALLRAMTGRYTQLEVQRGLSAARLITHFDQVSDPSDPLSTWAAKPALRRDLLFRRHNLLQPLPEPQEFDLILCRNMMIYQSVENKRRIIRNLVGCLATEGHLVLGGAESLVGITDEVASVEVEGVVLYRKPSAVKRSRSAS